jgi:hypothetical protein
VSGKRNELSTSLRCNVTVKKRKTKLFYRSFNGSPQGRKSVFYIVTPTEYCYGQGIKLSKNHSGYLCRPEAGYEVIRQIGYQEFGLCCALLLEIRN